MKLGMSSSQALRTWAKRTEAHATAKPYSVAIVGQGQSYLYCKGSLWYIYKSTLRLLETRQSPAEEIVIDLSSLLSKTGFTSQPKTTDSFSFLYYHEGVLSCLYRYSHQKYGGWLIAVDVRKPAILLSTKVASCERLFARHDREFLYYGVRTSNDGDDRKRWVLHGYDLTNGKYLGQNHFLYDLIGGEIGATICFEVIDGFFYAISNQTTYEVEEVDWTSFYHGRRFSLSSPTVDMLDKTENKCMWRRQHTEGTMDDRWTSLALATDETTGQLTIVESRKEWPGNCSLGLRTVYKTKLVFPPRPEIGSSGSCQDSAASSSMPYTSQNAVQLSGTAGPDATFQAGSLNFLFVANMSTSSNEEQRKQALAAITQDRLALTITPSNTPHFLPSQRRLPKNQHSESMQSWQNSFVISKTPAQYYNLSASAFMDVINDISGGDPTMRQCLRIRACSRRRKYPDQSGTSAPQERYSDTGEPIEGLGEKYEDGPLEWWPPALSAGGHAGDAASQAQDLHMLMNPSDSLGNVHGIFDETSLVYSTGQDGQSKAIVLVNFDPRVHLQGLKKWNHGRTNALGTENAAHATSRPPEATSFRSQATGAASPKFPKRPGSNPPLAIGEDGGGLLLPAQKRARTIFTQAASQSTSALPTLPYDREPSTSAAVAAKESWLRREPALYLSIRKGYSFGL